MNRHHLLFLIFVLPATLALSTPALASHVADVDVVIVSPRGWEFPTYPVRSGRSDVHRAYLEALNQEPYRIRVSNRSGQRVGLVIAVDGRNIISGQKSDLTPGERMYVLDPWESAEYEGWRTSGQRVHEFYFTEWADSYAQSFGDRSARGVIAVAVYREVHRRAYDDERLTRPQANREAGEESRAEAPAAAQDSAVAKGERSRAAEPGTGFGEEVYSPSRRVEFHPERRAASRHFFKYEWREALCRRGVTDCDGRERNRFWDDDERFGYAPYPPRR